ncbi:MAG TPA: TIGR03435 family protein [Granulicella sp.]|jgi:uncharacterized protein (TIGR03435 family)
MRLAHKIVLLVGSMILAWPLALRAQWDGPRLMGADGKPLEFDVVSVKPNHSGGESAGTNFSPTSDGITITNMPLEDVVQWAFGLFLSDEIAGLPEWAKHERYDVTAKVSDADVAAFRKVVDPVQRAPMLQKILVDRFHLKFHYEMKELPVYALVVGKNGVRMTEIQPAIGPNGMKDGGGRQVGRGLIRSMGQPMKPLVNQLSIELKRPVVDRTGLKGYYNFTLRWAPDEGAPPEGDVAAPSIFTAVQEQLGLKLEPVKASVQVLVIDNLERPSEN